MYLIDPDGKKVSEFIGAKGYIPQNPERMVMDQDDNVYVADFYDNTDMNHMGMVGVFKFSVDGTQIVGWGNSSSGVNAAYRPTLDFRTMTIDGSGSLVLLGSNTIQSGASYGVTVGNKPSPEPQSAIGDANHGVVFAYNRGTGNEISRNSMQYLMGYDTGYLGIIGAQKGGFYLLEARNMNIEINTYGKDGKRQSQAVVNNLYPIQ